MLWTTWRPWRVMYPITMFLVNTRCVQDKFIVLEDLTLATTSAPALELMVLNSVPMSTSSVTKTVLRRTIASSKMEISKLTPPTSSVNLVLSQMSPYRDLPLLRLQSTPCMATNLVISPFLTVCLDRTRKPKPLF